MLGVQALRYRVGCYLARLTTHRRLDGLEVQVLDRPHPYQGFGRCDDLPLEVLGERCFFSCASGAATLRALQIFSFTSITRSLVVRNLLYSVTSRSILDNSAPGRSCSVLVLPFILVV